LTLLSITISAQLKGLNGALILVLSVLATQVEAFTACPSIIKSKLPPESQTQAQVLKELKQNL